METGTRRAGVGGGADSTSSRLLGQVRITGSQDSSLLRPRDLGQQGSKEAQRRNVTLAPTGDNIIVHDHLLHTPGGENTSLPRSDWVTSFVGCHDRDLLEEEALRAHLASCLYETSAVERLSHQPGCVVQSFVSVSHEDCGIVCY